MSKQKFEELKNKHPSAIILLRCGDFYETYAEDARKTSEILGTTLTKYRAKDYADVVLLTSFPYFKLNEYLPRLIRAGQMIGIATESI